MQNTFNDITFTTYSTSKHILHTNKGKHYLISNDKKNEIDEILNSDDDDLKEELIKKINNLKSTLKNKHLFLTDFQFRKAIISEKNMGKISKPFEILYENRIFIFFIFVIAIILPYVYFFSNIFGHPSMISMGYTGFIFFFAFIFHEIGHATACVKFNAKPGEIGFGILSYLPILYADVTDAWRLQKKERMIVNFGGIYFQNLIAIILLLLSILFQNVGLFVISKTIFIASGYQFFPFYKSDGYWILSDIISEPNLFRNARKVFFKKLRNPFLKVGNKNIMIMTYYIMISSLIWSFIIRMWFHYYKYIIELPFYLYGILKEIIAMKFQNINFDIQYLWAFLYLYFMSRMVISNIKEFVLSKRGG